MACSRRGFLASFAAGSTYFGGCVSRGRRTDPVTILAAGSLTNAIENGLKQSVDVSLQTETYGSTKVARLVAGGQKNPDIVSVADVALFNSPLNPDGFAEFASNSIVVIYNPKTSGGQELAKLPADKWYQPLLDSNLSIGRTDPDIDPLGYRTLFTLELASDHYKIESNLRKVIPEQHQIYPETQLISQFETGGVDVAFAYRNMAVERGYQYIELPPAINLSDPDYADQYSKTTYELPGGKVVRGGVISYGSVVRQQSSVVVDVFDTLTKGRYLHEFGFIVPDDYPHYTGNVPHSIRN